MVGAQCQVVPCLEVGADADPREDVACVGATRCSCTDTEDIEVAIQKGKKGGKEKKRESHRERDRQQARATNRELDNSPKRRTKTAVADAA